MTVPVDIEFPLAEQLTATFRRAEQRGADLTPAMKEIAVHLESDTVLRFETETDPLGVPWIPSKRAREDGGKTLTDKGLLKNAIAADWGADHAAVGVLASGPPARYAAIHQFGGPITPRGLKGQSFAARYFMPARAYLGFTELNGAFALDVLEEHLGIDDEGTLQ